MNTTTQEQETRTAEAIKDVFKLGTFEPDELEPYKDNKTPYTVLKSAQFYNIIYFTNEGLYYLDEEQEKRFKELAEEVHETEKGIIFCYS